MSDFRAKPHIRWKGGRAVVEYRVPSVKAMQQLMPVSSSASSPIIGFVRDHYPGAWQQNAELQTPRSVLANGAVYACITLIAGDISKIDVALRRLRQDGTWQPVVGAGESPFFTVLRKPNAYQTWPQFVENWLMSKLLYGNTYVLKERDNRGGIDAGLTRAMYVLDPGAVTSLVSDSGDVFYKLSRDDLAGLTDDVTAVPATEVMHDRMNCLWHPLIGVSPIFAAGVTAMQGLSIQGNSAVFFQNMSRPSGILTAPKAISDDTAKRLKEGWEQNFQGGSIGRLAVLGDGLKYEPMTIPPADAQMIEQLGWTERSVCAPFHVPPYKIGLQTNVTFSNAAQLNQDYYSQCLQTLIKAMESTLVDGLELPANLDIEFDIEELMRMDPVALADADAKLVGAGIMAPNEARLKRNLQAVNGGEAPLIQQQNYSLPALAKRDAKDDPFAKDAPMPPAANERDIADHIVERLMPEFQRQRADDLDRRADPDAFARALTARVMREMAVE